MGRDHDADRLMTAVQGLVRRFSVAARADIVCCGMTVAQAATLDALAAEGPVTLTELRRRLGITASTMTRNIARLRTRGLVSMSTHPGDRRAVQVNLTPAGRRAAADVAAQERAFANSILGELGDDDASEVLLAVERLLGAVRSASQRCCPGAFDHLMTTPMWAGGSSDVELED